MTQPIDQLLPHRPPFVWIDEVLSVDPGVRCVAAKRLDPGEPCLAGHFPGNPILPGVLLIEAAAQTAGVMLATRPEGPPAVTLLASVNHFKFSRPVRPGEVMEIETRLRLEAVGMAVVAATIRVGNEVAATGEISVVSR